VTVQQNIAAREAVGRLVDQGVDVVRVVYPDFFGTDRGRDIPVDALPNVMEHGLAFCRAIYHTTPLGDVTPVAGGLASGLPDIIVYPDLATLAPLPWEPGVAQCIGDAYEADPLGHGRPVLCADSPRSVLKRVVGLCQEIGLTGVMGPELEFFLLERAGDGDPLSSSTWRRYGEAQGNVYVVGRRGDPDNVLVQLLRQIKALGVNATAANHEFCSGQFEINLLHSEALDAADRAFRLRAAVKELARQNGLMATFMGKPFNDEGGSGFHLHVSLVGEAGGNLMGDPDGEHGLSELAHQAIAGVLRHAPAIAALANPTVNAFKRLRPDSLAPFLIDWGLDNRSAMVRIPPERGGSARLEVRLGDASANAYLIAAAVLAAMYLGVKQGLSAPAPLEGYGYDPAAATPLPSSLEAALDALASDLALREALGEQFVDAFLDFKRGEVDRFRTWVTDWEFREYAYHL
jgi:glutamine synthetase